MQRKTRPISPSPLPSLQPASQHLCTISKCILCRQLSEITLPCLHVLVFALALPRLTRFYCGVWQPWKDPDSFVPESLDIPYSVTFHKAPKNNCIGCVCARGESEMGGRRFGNVVAIRCAEKCIFKNNTASNPSCVSNVAGRELMKSGSRLVISSQGAKGISFW